MHNFSMPVRGNNQSRPLVCLSYTWSCWCPGFLMQWTGSVGMLSSQVIIPSLTWLFAVVSKPHRWLLLLWDLELRIRLEPGTGSCLSQSQSFCDQHFPPWPPTLSCEVIQDVCPGCGMEEEEGVLVQDCF